MPQNSNPSVPNPPQSDDSAALFLLTESSLHAGTGSTLSYVDLPIQREVHSGHPIVYASSVKGALRERKGLTEQQKDVLFGPKNSDYSGRAIIQEARVLLFPVRSFHGTFAWVTCEAVLSRLRRDLAARRLALPPSVSSVLKQGETASFCSISKVAPQGKALLEDYCYDSAAPSPPAVPGAAAHVEQSPLDRLANWIATHAIGANELDWWREKLKLDIVLVHDDDFTFFVKVHTQIQTHVSIDKDTQIAASSGPRNEESLPPDTLLYSMVTIQKPLHDGAIKVFKTATEGLDAFQKSLTTNSRFHLCGNRTLGEGMVSAAIYRSAAAAPQMEAAKV